VSDCVKTVVEKWVVNRYCQGKMVREKEYCQERGRGARGKRNERKVTTKRGVKNVEMRSNE